MSEIFLDLTCWSTDRGGDGIGYGRQFEYFSRISSEMVSISTFGVAIVVWVLSYREGLMVV
jgi:hypothetical protein